MRSLDDIIIGFLIFFTIDRLINLFSKNVAKPFADNTMSDNAENCKLWVELACLIIVAFLIVKFRKNLQKLDFI